jgi:hypothetical protein
MLKNILKVNGAQQLSKSDQKNIHGGGNENCFSANIKGGCRCDFPNYCIVIPSTSSCPAGSVPASIECFE